MTARSLWAKPYAFATGRRPLKTRLANKEN